MGDYMAINLYQYFEKYSKEEIDLVINSLSLEYQNLIRRLYDKNGYFIDKNLLTRKDYLDSEYLLIVLLPRKLENVHIINTSSIYDLFYEYKAYLIDEILSLLSDNYKEIIFQRERFLSGQDNTYTVEDNKVFFNSIYPLVGELLKEDKITKDKENFKIGKGKSLYDLLGDYKKEEVDRVLRTLDPREKELLLLRYTKNYEYRCEAVLLDKNTKKRIDSLVYNKIKRSLKEGRSIKLYNSNLYISLKEYSKEEVRLAIISLSSLERDLLYKKYDSNFNVLESFKSESSSVKRKVEYLVTVKIPRLINDKMLKEDFFRDLNLIYDNHTKEEIMEGIKFLLDSDYQVLIKYYRNLEFNKNEEFKDREILSEVIYFKLQRILENSKVYKKGINLLFQYNKYSKEKIICCINELSQEERELLRLKYDSEYNLKSEARYLEKKVLKEIDKIEKRIGVLLKGEDNQKNDLLALYKNYSKDEIMLVIDGLSLEERNLVFLGYDSALKKKMGKIPLENSELSKYKNLIYRKIPRLLANKDKYVKKLGLFLRFKEYPENEILQVINSLSSEEKELLRLRYDDNYNFKEEFIYLEEEIKQKIYKIVGKMEMILCNFHKRNSYLNDLFYKYNNYSKEEILNVVEDLSFKERALFNLRYDEEYNLKHSFYALDSKTKQKVYILFSGVFRNRLEAFKTKANRDKYIFKRIEVARYILENSYLKELNALLDNKVLMVILMEKGYINGYCYSRMEISILLDMDIVLIEDILKMYDKKDKVLRLEKKEDGQI